MQHLVQNYQQCGGEIGMDVEFDMMCTGPGAIASVEGGGSRQEYHQVDR